MNEDTAQRPGNELDLGIQFTFFLDLDSNREHRGIQFTIGELIAALESTTTLTDLTVTFYGYESTPENNRLIVEPLCRCIANLRRRNNHHPLRKLTLYDVELDVNGMLNVLEQFLVAGKEFGITELELIRMQDLLNRSLLPVQFLFEFCRDNNDVKVLEICDVNFFSQEETALSFPWNNGPQGSSIIMALDYLSLTCVVFNDSTAATEFANFVARMNVSALELGGVTAREVAEDDDDDIELRKRIVSEFKVPSVEQLTFRDECRVEHFQAALEAGQTSLIELHVSVNCDQDDTLAKLESLTRMIHGAIKLNILTIGTSGSNRMRRPVQLLQAVEACATVTQIQVENYGRWGLTPHQIRQMQRIAARNEELGRFVASPSIYPTYKLLDLMRQLDRCPTGRYRLARCLPEMFSFQRGNRLFLPTKPSRRKRDPPPKPIRQLRRRRNNAHHH